MRKVALISEHASPLAILGGIDSGGQNVYVAHLALNLAQMGYSVDVFTRRESECQEEIFSWQPGVRVIHVPAGPAKVIEKEKLLPHMNEFSQYMIHFCLAEQYDLIHANFWMSGLVAMNLKEALQIPFVITFHALGKIRRLHQREADGFPEERMEIEEEIMSAADCIIAECPQDRHDLIRFYNADPKKIAMIPCGFDPQEFNPLHKDLARKELGLPLSEKIILQLGRMVPRKGVETVIRSMGFLSRMFNVNAKLVIVGGNSDHPNPKNTPEIGRLYKIAEEENVKDSVVFVGRKSRPLLKLYYNAADLFVTTPWYEPFGITPLEAMACGTPVVGSNVGGIKFTVKDGITGFLVPPKNPVKLAEKMANILNNNHLLGSFKLHASKHAQQFIWSHIVKNIKDLYEEVCLRHVTPSHIFR
jgi:D-inositol-3-phosphate glycosyltransferase